MNEPFLWASREQYAFDDFTLDVSERLLRRGPERLHLAPKTFDVLLALIRRAGHLTTKSELLETVWPNVFVDQGILTVHVTHLRKALGDVKRQARYIETVSRFGYRFIAAVSGPASTAHVTSSATVSGLSRR